MRKLANISKKTTVKELLERYPQVLTIFIELNFRRSDSTPPIIPFAYCSSSQNMQGLYS